MLEKLYDTVGGPFIQWQGIADWSGQDLGGISMLELQMLGGSSPSALEQSWRDAGTQGSTAGFAMSGAYRGGMVATVGAAAKAPGATDTVASLLTEFPYPKATGNCQVDFTVSSDFCLSPYPSEPWRMDWTTNPGREQSLRAYPLFYQPSNTFMWSDGPLVMGGGPDPLLEPAPDYLIVYWFARVAGIVGPND